MDTTARTAARTSGASPTASPDTGHAVGNPTAFAHRGSHSSATVSPFTERYARRLPRGFADEAAGMDWRTMVDTFAPSSDHFHLADFSRRPLGRGITAYEAILATRTAQDAPGHFTAHRLTTESCGDLTAMSDMLSRVGARVEIERFHQYEGATFDGTGSWCTILRATCGRRSRWALGFGRDSSEASIAALLNAATLLHLR